MEVIPFGAASKLLASQEIPQILWTHHTLPPP